MLERLAPIVAHGGRFTWDEALLVLVPIVAFAGLLALANQRAKAIQAARQTPERRPEAEPDPEDHEAGSAP